MFKQTSAKALIPMKFVYEEVWLHELVPQHATNSVISLNFSLHEATTATLPVNTCSQPTHVNQSSTITCASYPSNNNNKQFQNSQPTHHLKFSKNSMPTSLTNLSEKELWNRYIFCTTRMPRGRRTTSFKIEFSEHIFSKLFNGKVQNHQGFKVKNRLIPKGLYSRRK